MAIATPGGSVGIAPLYASFLLGDKHSLYLSAGGAFLGGGGSVLATPLLIYLVGVRDPHVAIGTSAAAVRNPTIPYPGGAVPASCAPAYSYVTPSFPYRYQPRPVLRPSSPAFFFSRSR